MPSEILAIGSAVANSADVEITATTTVCLKDASGPSVSREAKVDILLKDDAGQYYKVGELTGGAPAQVIIGPGTYRFTRMGGESFGVFSG